MASRGNLVRFWSKVDRSELHGCWLWTGAINTRGHGNVGWNGKTCSVHRVAWEIMNGKIPEGMFIYRSCSNKLCVNPIHLVLATRQELNKRCSIAGKKGICKYWRAPLDDVTRFWSHVDKSTGPNGCWIWARAPVQGTKYGAVRWAGKTQRAHRVAWQITLGEVPGNMCVLHKCDNPLCVNPGHLFLGTRADNAADRDAKGRQACGDILSQAKQGELNSQAKLNESGVREIRSLVAKGVAQAEIARRRGVSQAAVWNIVNGRTWRHVL